MTTNPTPTPTTQSITITTSSACEPTAHATGCRDLIKVRRRRDFGGEYVIDAESKMEISLDYWSDIIHSDHGLAVGSPEAAQMALDYLHSIAVAPCVRLPLAPSTGAETANQPAPASTCPACGFAFRKPQAKCRSTKACEARQAAAA